MDCKKLGTIATLTLLACGTQAAAQQAPAGQTTIGRPGGNRQPVGPTETDRYRSRLVQLGGGARDGLLYEPKVPNANTRVAIVYSDRNFGFDPPAAELADLGYRVLYVSYPALKPGEVTMPLDGFVETSRGIAYLRALPGVRHVVIEGWGAGATSMTLYANVAAHGAAACQAAKVLDPCPTAQATGLARPDGLILLDPGLGAGSKMTSVDPAYEGNARNRRDLDKFEPVNGYDPKTGAGDYAPAFRVRYFAAQSARNDAAIDAATALTKTLPPGSNAPFAFPGAVNVPAVSSLHNNDLRLMAHTKQPHLLLKADGSRAMTILHSIRPQTGPVGAEAVAATLSHAAHDTKDYTVREFLGNDAIRTTPAFALIEDDILGIDWASTNVSTPSQAEGVTVPTLVMTNSCFQFVVSSEIAFDHLAATDKTMAGVEGSAHEFTPCKPEYGDTKKRLFGFVAEWLAKPGRF